MEVSMRRYFKIFYIVALFALICFALTGCMDSEMIGSEVEAGTEAEEISLMPWEHIGASFRWFFNVFTPAYWKSSSSIWGLLSLAQECWDIPSLIGFVFAVLMNAVVFIVALATTAMLLFCYVLALALFVAVFLFLIVVAIGSLLLSFISFGLLSL
jgi:hypothetical protein